MSETVTENAGAESAGASAAEAAVKTDFAKIVSEGLWAKNPITVQMLGLCPMLAVSGTVVNALGLGIATIIVLMVSNGVVSLARSHVPDEVRLPVFVMVIASATTAIEFIMQAWTFELYEILGIFIALITTNCSVLARADAFASKNPLLPSLLDGFMMGTGFAAVLVLLGAMRELLGQGTLFAGMDLLFGPAAKDWTLHIAGSDYRGFLFAMLPPGAFVGLGLLIALKNVIDNGMKERAKARAAAQPRVSRRVRTTG